MPVPLKRTPPMIDAAAVPEDGPAPEPATSAAAAARIDAARTRLRAKIDPRDEDGG